jgi:hypothetical protein
MSYPPDSYMKAFSGLASNSPKYSTFLKIIFAQYRTNYSESNSNSKRCIIDEKKFRAQERQLKETKTNNKND